MPDVRSFHPQWSRYWRKIIVLTVVLGGAWLFISLLPFILVQTPQNWTILGWPFAYAIVAFGAPLAYLTLIGIYAWLASRADRDALEQEVSD